MDTLHAAHIQHTRIPSTRLGIMEWVIRRLGYTLPSALLCSYRDELLSHITFSTTKLLLRSALNCSDACPPRGHSINNRMWSSCTQAREMWCPNLHRAAPCFPALILCSATAALSNSFHVEYQFYKGRCSSFECLCKIQIPRHRTHGTFIAPSLLSC